MTIRGQYLHILTILCAIMLGGLVASSTPALAQPPTGGPDDQYCTPGDLGSSGEACMLLARQRIDDGLLESDAKQVADAFHFACDLGRMEGCIEAAEIYQSGGGGLQPNLQAAGNFQARACERKVAQACVDALALFSAPGSGSKNLRRVGLIYRKLCFDGDIQACELGAFIAADGYQGRFSASKDLVLARELATYGCRQGNSETLCLLGEELYSDFQFDGADPFTQMEFARINCARDIDSSCFSLAAFHQKREEWIDAINYYQKSCGLGMARACGLGNQVKQFYEVEILPAKQEQDQFQAMLDNREYADAVWAAIYHFKTADKLAYAIRTINAKGGMGSVPTNYLYITASWFSHGEIRNIADREMARRGTGLEGTFGTGTNNAGQASARWQAANGSSYSPSRSSAGGGYTPVPGPSTAEIVENTRKKYHYVNCVMSKIPNNPNC